MPVFSAEQIRRRLLWIAAPCAAILLSAAGCGSPSKANIELRKTLQARDEELATLKRQHEADVASMRAFESRTRPTVESLPEARLARMFTTHGIKFGKLTRLLIDEKAKPALRVSFTPTDNAGDPLKAAGAITIEAFSLGSDSPRIGKWEFDTDQTRGFWFGDALRYEYVVTCPLESNPAGESLTIRLTFRDELTGRTFTAETTVAPR